jgi:WD40 repeat protein
LYRKAENPEKAALTRRIIRIYSPERSLQQWLNSPTGVVFGTDGHLYISNFTISASGVRRYHGATGAFLDNFVLDEAGGLDRAVDVAFGPDGNLYVSSYGTSSVKRYDGITGAFLGDFVTEHSGDLQGPAGLVFGPDGYLYVSSYDANSVKRYDGTTGQYVDTFVVARRDLHDPLYLLFTADTPMTPITCAEPHSGELSSPAETDYFTFHGEAGELVQITVEGTGGGLSGDDVCWRLSAPNGKWVSGILCGVPPHQRFELAESGTYTIGVLSSTLSISGG